MAKRAGRRAPEMPETMIAVLCTVFVISLFFWANTLGNILTFPTKTITQITSLCGNSVINTGEDCDGTQLGGKNCAGVLGTGYTGTLKCKADCKFNTTLCTAPQTSSAPSSTAIQTETTTLPKIGTSLCGNGVLNAGEACDGTKLGGKTCTSVLGTNYEGTLSCRQDCTIGTSQCTLKPQTGSAPAVDTADRTTVTDTGTGAGTTSGQTQGQTTTDGQQIISKVQTVTGIGAGTDTQLVVVQCGDGACSGLETAASCPADCGTIQQNLCGNGVINTGESCDGTQLGGKTCATQKGDGWTGTLKCKSDCTFNTSLCTAPSQQQGQQAQCGNGILEGSEACDSDDVTCDEAMSSDTPAYTGTASCKADCSGYDTSACEAVSALPEEAKALGNIGQGATKRAIISDVEGLEVSEVAITARQALAGVNVNVKRHGRARPDAVSADPAEPLYTYLEISTNAPATKIQKVQIKFQVKIEWVESDNIDSTTITLQRYDEILDAWTKLTAAKINEDSTYYYYKADSPGLSYFAVTGEEQGGGDIGGDEGGEQGPACGDGTCDADEDEASCPADCETGGGGQEAACGDGTCDADESEVSCPADCEAGGGGESGTACGDGTCDMDEDDINCPDDCAAGGGEGEPGTGITATRSDAQAAISAAQDAIEQALAEGKDVSAAIKKLNEATKKLAAGDYKRAMTLAATSESLAASAEEKEGAEGPALGTEMIAVIAVAAVVVVVVVLLAIKRKPGARLPVAPPAPAPKAR